MTAEAAVGMTSLSNRYAIERHTVARLAVLAGLAIGRFRCSADIVRNDCRTLPFGTPASVRRA